MTGKPAARLGEPAPCPTLGHSANPTARMGDASGCAMANEVAPTVLINGTPTAILSPVASHRMNQAQG